MNDVRYQEEFSLLINDIISVNGNISSLESLIQKTNSIQERNKEYLSDQINAQNVFNYFMRQLRLKYQAEISNNINNESKIILISKLIIQYIFWFINENKFGIINNSLKIIQDIVETIPLIGLVEIFNLISNSLKKMNKKLIDQGKLDILFIIKSLFKRTETNLDSNLRGKIQLLSCELFSLTDKSGVNLMCKYSKNQINEEEMEIKNEDINKMEIEENIVDKNNCSDIKNETVVEKQDLIIQLYKQFWIIEKILINPFTVCLQLFI